MAKMKFHNKNAGFTLMEILITIGLVSIIAGVVAFIDINSFRGDSFRAEVNAIATALQTARANSFNNVNQSKHGVAFNPGGFPGYVIFEGNSYATADHSLDISIKSSYTVSFSSTSPTEITFDQLSGNGNYNGDITLIDPQRGVTTSISINHEGKISW